MRRKILAIGIRLMLIIIVGCTGNLMAPESKASANSRNAKSTNDLESKFAYLSAAKTNFCAGPSFISQKLDDERLQGSCCSKMDLHLYQEQADGLRKYSEINEIPKDPYDIEVSLAKKLLEFQKNIRLDALQQKAYDDAMNLSHEGGPCCCKCWRYDVFEGLAKYLITELEFSAEQVAEVWNLLDGCGGEGHTSGVHT